jgi:phosphoribosylglycinamide formyltransferase-1
VKKIAIFASGRGSNFIKIYESIQHGEIPGEISCLISDNEKAGAFEYAQSKSIPISVISPKNFKTSEAFGLEILKVLNQYQVEWIILAGYLKKIPDNVVSKYSNHILNIHPALLPAFGGKGMYGIRVHQAVFESGAKISGVTVHLVNKVYDAGPIVMQKAVNIEDCRNPEEIAHKVLKVEHILFSRAIKKIFTSNYEIISNRVIFY